METRDWGEMSIMKCYSPRDSGLASGRPVKFVLLSQSLE
jgi:hypothetical protein